MERDAQFKPLNQWIPSADKGQIDSHPSKIHQIRGSPVAQQIFGFNQHSSWNYQVM